MKRLSAVLLLAAVLLTGCGSDGDSSSGGGSSNSTGGGTGAPVDLSTLAGNYAGSSTITVSALGISETDTAAVQVTIADRGAISLRFDESVLATGTLAADGGFLIRDTLANAGVDECSGSISITGRATPASVTAQIRSENASCSGIPASARGSLNATRR